MMHRAFAAWLSERPWRAVLSSASLGVLSYQGLSPFAVVAGALPVFITLRRDVAFGTLCAVAGAVAGAVVLLRIGQPPGMTCAYIAALFFAPLALAVLVRQTQSLNLAFQCAVLGIGVLLGILYLVLDNPTGFWEPFLRDALKSLTQKGLVTDADAVVTSMAHSLWGMCAALFLLTLLGALFLGRWWQSLLEAPGGFGREFRSLRLGQFLGVTAMIIVLVAMLKDIEVIDALGWVAVTALAFQGLAAAHQRKQAGRMSRGMLVAMYILLIVPLSAFIMVSVLAGWGLADNWRRLRLST
jgi:hypothetical protein